MGTPSGMQTTKNLGANICYFVINILIGIFLIPYYIDILGIAAYGLIPLATSLIGYIGLLTNSLNSAVARHITIDLHGFAIERANGTFNSAFFGMSRIVIAAVPIVFLISIFAPMVFGVPSSNSADAMWLFIGVGLAFLIRAWSSNFTVTLYASNRIDLINTIQLTNLVSQVLLIITLFNLSSYSLASIGISYVLSAIIATMISIILYRRNNDGLRIKYCDYNSQKFKEMAKMGGWVIIDQIGTLLLLNIDLIVVNYLYGSSIGGEYALAYQWSTLIRALAGTFVSVLGPITLIAYAKGQMERILEVTKSSVKIVGIGMALPIGILCGFAPLVLSLWVGGEFSNLAPLMIILTAHQVVNLAVTPLFNIDIAYNKVRLPAIITIISGVGNVILALSFAQFFGFGVYGVAIAGLVILTLKNLLFTPIYASMLLNVPKHTFYPSLIPGSVATFVIAIMSWIVSLYMEIDSLLLLLFIAGMIAIVFILFSWTFLLNKNEKSLIPLKENWSINRK